MFESTASADSASFALPARVRAFRISEDGFINHVAYPALYDLERAGFIATVTGHTSQVYSAQFVRGDQQILTAGTDGTARFWNGWTCEPQQILQATEGMLLDAALSPDGTRVVTAGGDGYLRFWDLRSGKMLWRLRAHGSYVSAVHFEGDRLISRGTNGDLARWQLATPSRAPDRLVRFDDLVRCGPLEFDDETGTLVSQVPRCTAARR